MGWQTDEAKQLSYQNDVHTLFFLVVGDIANDQSTSAESVDAQYTGQITSDKKHKKGTDFQAKQETTKEQRHNPSSDDLL